MTGDSCRCRAQVEIFPVLRYRLSFACLAARHISSAPPGTVVAVDLPRSLDRHEWLCTALGGLPKTSNILLAQSEVTYCIPAVPNDAAWLALQVARTRGLSFHCVDDAFPHPLPEVEGRMPDDTQLTSVEQYFAEAPACAVGSSGLAERAARIATRLRELSSDAQQLLFICDWRIAHAVLNALSSNGDAPAEPPANLSAAIVPEDSTLLWQCGFLDDLPALTARVFEGLEDVKRSKLDVLNAILSKVSNGPSLKVRSTVQPTLQLLEPAVEILAEQGQAKLAALLLSYPEWSLDDLSNGDLPRFAAATNGKLSAAGDPFDLKDIFGCMPLYQPSRAEMTAFAPPSEMSVRRYWGPDPQPPLTRTESAVKATLDNRWTVPASFVAMAEGARLMREAAQEMVPGLPCDLFTPACWWFNGDSDGDHRSLQDVNGAYRRHQLDEFPEIAAGFEDEGRQPDVLYTLSATRCMSMPLCLGVSQDIACSLAIVYTGPESGPDRYRAVRQREPLPRLDPSEDREIAEFPLGERSLAFAIKNARGGVVLLAHSDGLKLSCKIEGFAGDRNARIIRMPLTVMPPALTRAIQRRIFLSKSIRWSENGARVADRIVNWRVPPEVRSPRRRHM